MGVLAEARYYLYGTDGPEQVPQLHVCGGGGEAFYGDGAAFVPCSPLVLSAGRWTASTHLPTSTTSTRHHDLHPKAGVRETDTRMFIQTYADINLSNYLRQEVSNFQAN